MQKMSYDFPCLARELVKAVRGGRSQTQVNRKLGLNYNLVYRWEAGTQAISWTDFVELCRVCQCDLSLILKKHVGLTETPQRYGRLVQILIGTRGTKAASKALGVSPYVIRSWQTERSGPTLVKMLELIDASMAIVPEFCSEFAPSPLPSLQDIYDRQKSFKNLIYKNPWMESAITALALDSYKNATRHPLRFFSKTIGLTAEQEDQALESLSKLGAIEKTKSGKYESTLLQLDTRGNFQGSNQIRIYWLDRLRKFAMSLKASPKNSLSGYFHLAVSANAQEKIRSAYYEFCNTVAQIVKDDDQPREKVLLALVNITDLADVAAAELSRRKQEP